VTWNESPEFAALMEKLDRIIEMLEKITALPEGEQEEGD